MMRTLTLCLGFCFANSGLAADITVKIGFLKQQPPAVAVLSNLDPTPEDLGVAGAGLGLSDNRTTGGFLGHDYRLETRVIAPDDDPVAAARDLLASHRLLLLDTTPAALTAIADLPEAEGALLFNTGAAEGALRGSDCRANLLHTLPETAMQTDALMQLLLAKRWTRVAMITGPRPEDEVLAAAYRRSATKFGIAIAIEKAWSFDTDLRRAAAAEVPLFTQDLGDYDMLIVADAHDDFARYIEHNTWLPRPVAGSAGLRPQGWAPVVEQWGAAQLQQRFEELAHRDMHPHDYAAWTAMRSIGEAVTRTGSAAPDQLRGYILSDAFRLDGFQGRPLSFRPWNGQMRQPIPVANADALVSSAPLDGFEHQVNQLDSLGTDRHESTCTTFGD